MLDLTFINNILILKKNRNFVNIKIKMKNDENTPIKWLNKEI